MTTRDPMIGTFAPVHPKAPPPKARRYESQHELYIAFCNNAKRHISTRDTFGFPAPEYNHDKLEQDILQQTGRAGAMSFKGRTLFMDDNPVVFYMVRPPEHGPSYMTYAAYSTGGRSGKVKDKRMSPILSRCRNYLSATGGGHTVGVHGVSPSDYAKTIKGMSITRSPTLPVPVTKISSNPGSHWLDPEFQSGSERVTMECLDNIMCLEMASAGPMHAQENVDRWVQRASWRILDRDNLSIAQINQRLMDGDSRWLRDKAARYMYTYRQFNIAMELLEAREAVIGASGEPALGPQRSAQCKAMCYVWGLHDTPLTRDEFDWITSTFSRMEHLDELRAAYKHLWTVLAMEGWVQL